MATYYVGTPTSGTGNGSITNPWNQAGFDAATLSFGDTLTVNAGSTLTTTVNQLLASLPTTTLSERGELLGNERQTITAAPGTLVAYGAGSAWSYRVVGATGQISLNNDTFNDPVPGTTKAGYVVSSLAISSSGISGTYNISDRADALVINGGALFNGATDLTSTTAATVAQATTIEGFDNTGSNTYNITDTAANLTASSNEVLTRAVTVTASTDATASQADTIGGFDKAVVYSISDTASNVAGASSTALNEAVNITATGTATVAEATKIVNANNTGTNTYSITDAASNLAAASFEVLNGASSLTVSGASASAADLNTADGKTTVILNANSVGTLTGSASAVATAISTDTINTAGNVGVTVDAGPAAATDLNTIDSYTSATVNATAVTTITGTAVAVQTAITAATIDTATDVAATVDSGTATVAQANAIDGATTGVVTATITQGDLSTLAGLTGTGNAYTITITDSSAAASALTTLDGKTTVPVNAAAVTTLTGTVAEVNATYSANTSGTITGLGDEAVTITNAAGGTLLASDLSTAGAATTGTVTVSDAQTVTGTASELTAALVTPASRVVMGADSSATVSDATTVAIGSAIATTSNITASFSGGISDTLSNLASGGSTTTALNHVVADDADVVITITDTTGMLQAADLSAVGGATTGTVTVSNAQTVSGMTDQVIAAVLTEATKVTLNPGSTINASGYTNQDLSSIASSFTLNVTTADTAVLDSAKLATADSITIGTGSATIDASSTDEVALAAKTTVNNGTTLTVNNYVDTDLSGLSTQGSGLIVVNTTTGAVLDEAKLADATSVVLGTAATGAASAIDGIGTNGSRINLNTQTLSVSGYLDENLSGITGDGTVNVTTANGAQLVASNLTTADAITVVGTSDATAADADALGSRLTGMGTVNITSDPITTNTDLSDLGSGLTLQFGGDSTVAVNDATLTVRQDQVSGFTISGNGTVSAAGTASVDSFNASGITANLSLTSLAANDSITVAPANLGSSDSIDGGANTDTLIFSAATTSVVDASFTNVTNTEILQLANGTNSIGLGSEAENSGAGISTVTGSTGADTLNLDYGATGLTFNAGTGSDTLSYSADSDTQLITLSSIVSGVASGTVSNDGTDTFIGLEAIVGGSGSSDLITSTSSGETLVVTGANAGTIDGFAFSGVESVNLGLGNDTASINNGGSLSGNLNLGDGNNTLTFNSGAGAVGSVSAGTGNDSVTISAGSITGALDLGTGTDSLSYAGYGSAVSATLSGTNALSSTTAIGGGVNGVENVTLSSFNDTFLVADGGTLSGTLNLGGGSDTLSYSGYTSAVTVSLNSSTSTAAGGATGITGTVTGFENLVGGSGSDSLNASSGINSLNVAADGTTTLDTILTVSGFETINLGNGSDSVTLAAQFAGSIDGGAGDSDVLNLNASANEVTLTSPGAGSWGTTSFSNFEVINLLGAADTFTINGSGSITSVDGGSESDSLILNRTTTNDVVTVSNTGAGTISSGGTSIGSFSAFESIDLGSGGDSLTYAGYGTAVSLTLDSISSSSGTSTTGGATGFSGTVSGFETVVGSSNSDSLIATAADNTLILTGANQGTIDGLSFSSFESVDLADGNDSAQFTSGDSLSGTLAGGAGTDTLDYSVYGSGVTVNLASGTATGTGAISGFETVLGSNSADTITASTSGNVNLQGNGGNDTFTFTVSGLTSADSVDGGNGSDTLVFSNVGTISDTQFTNVSLVESVTLTGASTISLGSEAKEATIATITTGTSATTVNSTVADYDLTVNATSLGDGNSLTLTGSASNNFTVTGLNGSLSASGTSGSLIVNTVNAGDNAIGVTTGSGNTTINGSGTNDTITVNADAMVDNTTLDINGSATYSATNLEANTDAAGTTGSVSLAYGDVSDNAASIATGSGATTVSGSTSGDTLTINAASLAQNTTLTESGAAQQVVTNLVGDINATGLSGTLTVTTGDAVDNGISISTGTTNTTINASGSGDIVMVNADAMADDTTLDLNGSATFSVSNLEADTNAADTTGSVGLSYGNVTGDNASITTGSGAISVSGISSGDTLSIDAAALANNTSLTLSGAAAIDVTGLSGDVNANSPVSYSDDFSSLSGWSGGILDSSVAYYGSFLGRFANGAKTNGQDASKTFVLAGQPATISFDVHRIDSWDGEAFRAYVNDTVAFQTTFVQGQNINTQSGSTNGFSWTITPKDTRATRGFAGWDEQTATVTITVPGGLPSLKLGFGSGLDQGIDDESYGIDNLSITSSGGTLSGPLTITTADNTVDNGISIVTGTANTTINASGSGDTVTVNADAMADNTTLDLNGSATFSVSNLEANTDAAGTTGTVNLAYTDVSDNAASITTGSGATTVSGTSSGDTLTINAAALAQNSTLTESGAADQVVNNLVGDISATALTGTLTVTTADAGDGGIDISTGTNNTTITASASGDTVTVNADAMADNKTLDLNGTATFSVSNLEANTDAAGTSGSVNLAYTDVTDNAASISTGSGATTVSGTTSGDTLTINAAALAQNTTLTVSGAADQVVNNLVGDISATALTGTLTVTTSDAGDGGIDITTGTNNATITASGFGDTITVNADAMEDNKTLDLKGSAVYSVSNLEANTDAAGTSGSVNLAYTDVSDNAASISTGSGATTVSGSTSGDTLTINAASLAQNTTLTESGAANQVVNNLVGDISATALTGTLTVSTGDAVDGGIDISTGTANTTINASGSGDTVTVNADAMADNTTLDLNGSATFSVSNLEANTDAAGSTGSLTIAYANVTDDKATLLTGSGNVVVTGGDADDTVTVTGLSTNNQTFSSLSSTSNFNITAGANNQTITASNTGNDTIDGGSGYDTLSYAGGTNVDVTITSFASQSGGSTGQGTDTFTGIENLVGAAGTDTLRGIEGSSDEIAVVDSANAGYIYNTPYSGSFDFSSFEQIDLNAGNDVLAITGSGSLSSSADGGVGTDRLDYTGYTASAVTVDLNTNTATAIAGDLVGVSGDSSFEDIYGSASSDTLIGDNTANDIRGYDGGDTILGLDGNDTLDGGDGTSGPDGADVIAGGDGADLILGSDGSDFISGGGYVFEGSYFADPDASIDTLSYADENEGLDISLEGTDKGTVLADAGATLTVSTFTNTYNGSGAQTIYAPTNQTTGTDWTDTYGDIQNLVLTGQNDIVRIETSDLNTGSIDAVGGSLDTLDYSTFDASSPVVVNLSGISNYTFDFDANGVIDTSIGEITITNAKSATNIKLTEAGSQGGADGVDNFEVVIGGAADDAIVGNDSANILVGNDGSDRIAGLDGEDTIYGGKGDDYIIPGDDKDYVNAGEGINTILITSQDFQDGDVFAVDPNGINIFKLNGDGVSTGTSVITAPAGTSAADPWDPGEQGIDLLDGGDPVLVGGVAVFDTIEGTSNPDYYQFGTTAFKNIQSVDLGAGDDSVGTAPTSKGIIVDYDGGTGSDTITLTLTFQQFARLNQSGLYVADVQNYIDDPTGETFSSTQADFTATNFESGGVQVIIPAVYNSLQGDPAAITFNSSVGLQGVTASSGDDLALSATALTSSTARASSTEDLVSAFVQANTVKGADAVSLSSGGDVSGFATAEQTASASAITVDDRSDAVLSAYGLGVDRSAITAGGDVSLTLSGTVKADTTGQAVNGVVNANGTAEAAGSRDSSLTAADAVTTTASGSVTQTVTAGVIDGLAVAGLASRTYGIDDANLTDATTDSVQAGSNLTLEASATANSRVTASGVGSQSLGSIELRSSPSNPDRVVFPSSLWGVAAFPLIDGDRIRFSTTPPNGSVQADRDYYVFNVIPISGEFQISSTPDGDPIDLDPDSGFTLQAFRPAVSTADAISSATAVDLNRSAPSGGGLQAGQTLNVEANAYDGVRATATSVDGDATAGLNRLGGLDDLNTQPVSSVVALSNTASFSGSDAAIEALAGQSASLLASTTSGDALAEANVQVLGSDRSASTAGGDLDLQASASLSVVAQASTTDGRSEARSGAGAGAGSSTGNVSGVSGNALPDGDTYALSTGLVDGSQVAGADLDLAANATLELTATASTTGGTTSLGSLWSNGSNVLSTFDPAATGLGATPSLVGPQFLADGQRVQLPAGNSLGLAPDTDYVVRLLASQSVDSSDSGATANMITMPTGITYTNGDAIRFRLNSTTPANSSASRYGIALGTTYYVSDVAGSSFRLATAPGGPAIDLTPDSVGLEDQLVDADRFQLLVPPANPGDAYTVATLTANQSNVTLNLPAEANAFAGSRQAGITLADSDTITLAQVSGVDGSGLAGGGGLLSLLAGAGAAVTAFADGVLNALARNTDGDASASAGLVAEGLNDAAISAGADGTLAARATINATAEAISTGENPATDNSLSSLNLAARAIDASAADQDISLGADGTVTATAAIDGRSTAALVNGDADALGSLEATGLRAGNAGFTVTIGEVGDLSASARLGSSAAPLVISALSSGAGDATAQAASAVEGILGTLNAGSFSSIQAGAAQGDIAASASANQLTQAIATDGAASVFLGDVSGTGSAMVSGIRNMALTAGADLSRIEASAIGSFQQEARAVEASATSFANSNVSGILSDAATPLPVNFAANGVIAAVANNTNVSRALSVAGDASSGLSSASLGLGNASVVIGGNGELGISALSRSSNQAQSVLGNVSA